MIKTEVNKLEAFAVDLFFLSQSEQLFQMKSIAQNFICEFLNHIKAYDALFLTDHTKIVNSIYFSKHNILVKGMLSYENKTYVSRPTLYRYRQKYAKLMLFVMNKLGIEAMYQKMRHHGGKQPL